MLYIMKTIIENYTSYLTNGSRRLPGVDTASVQPLAARVSLAQLGVEHSGSLRGPLKRPSRACRALAQSFAGER